MATLALSCIANAAVQGDNEDFESPNGITEHCVAIDHAPGGDYSAQDVAEERSLCAIDFYSGNFALCPKTFSTSPGTLIYDVSTGSYAGKADQFEADHCRKRKIITVGVVGDPVSYKMTMNGPETSATFAPASLLYYHFSRYLDTVVDVPVSVWRSMDRREHFDRVVRTGLDVSSSGGSPMNRAGWETLEKGAEDPASYQPTSELYTEDGRQIFGILLRSDGRRYGAEINGTRRSGWGAGQNRDLQETAPYLALRHEGPLSEAIAHGVATATQDPDLRKAMTLEPTELQMTFWMTELTEVVVLDFIFSQQDRVGNIDYRDFWYWALDGKIERRIATTVDPPAEIAPYSPVRVRRSIINDNDAGGRIPYANFAKTTGMVENLRHFRGSTYRRLQQLAADLKRSGPMYEWLHTSFGISERQVAQVVKNTVEAAGILQDACVAGRLRFSLDPLSLIAREAMDDSDVPCGVR